MSEVTVTTRTSKFMELSGVFNWDGDFIEMTEWSNGEGFDVQTHEKGMGTQHVSLSYETMDALIHLYTDKTRSGIEPN